MTKKLIPIFLFIITINGWATSRFSVYINGQKSGEIIVKRTFNKNFVITETEESLTLKRGGAIIKSKNLYKTKELKDGTPVELNFRNLEGNSSILPEFQILFKNNSAILITPMGKQSIPVNLKEVKQDYGEEITLKKMIEKGIKQASIKKFDQNILNFDKITITFKGKTKKGYKFILKSGTLNTEEERLTDKNGNILISTMNFAGMEFKVVNQKLEKKKTKTKGAEIFSPSLIKIKYFVPRGFSVSEITYKLVNSSPYDFTIIETDNQKVKILDNKSCLLTVSRVKLPLNAKPDRDENYLKSSPIINLNNKKLKEITENIRKNSKDTYSFVKNTITFVFNYIQNKNFDNVMADTDTILKEKNGDCTEHSFLATAIFRKAKIPARCVVGLVMGDNIFGYHMWVEVKLNGKWYPVDPTLNQINPDPTHIRIDEFPITPSTMKNIYKIILPLIRSLAIEPVKVKFENGKTIGNPKNFFENLFGAKNWAYDNRYFTYTLSKKEGIFKETIYLASLYSKDTRQLGINLSMFEGWEKHYNQDIKGKYVMMYEDKNKIGFAFVHNSVLIVFVAESLRPVKIEKFREFIYNKCLEVIEKCQKEF
ncbi:hypothetical protein TTHT_2249 [Thermotomaculum hydrothermale]|uniref:Transglutaminase-like domain-containing protein n=1 Tax=Thermotomaculum hydrothermale TaxID=981385 RepID=A0A7R6PST0_9BACT|nr:transglutaminase-like domain-containing protein [Thermotomaculum hydrothermale]BBB33671.1 hypothetical protein TTHT_2249 [Thermotomaculum hydrothermale]